MFRNEIRNKEKRALSTQGENANKVNEVLQDGA